ncbi:diiron oxygenase [Actinoplanes sp. NPDC051475]|uniref:diiron oxygenase n=1 Tax=Actinoplanes sp. NPDC051475 TaxID=3157225 RepID=UPI003450BFDE
MCGVLGLFIGCAAVAFCPVQAPPETGDGEEQPEYRSAFTNWYERSSVRRAPRRNLDDDAPGVRLFSTDLVPLARHPLVAEAPEPILDEVLTQHLYRYLDFTAKLEYLVVNRTVLGIAHGSVGVAVPDEMRLDGFKIYCDEAYHALFTADLRAQVQRRTGIAPRLPSTPYFLARLSELQEQNPDVRALVEILFVIVSETLISATLAAVPDDPTVSAAVRGMIDDHAVDEGRHHAYFASFLTYLWGELTPQLRIRAAMLVPDLIDAFLRPDLPALRTELLGYRFGADDTEQVLAEVFPREVIEDYARTTSQHTLRHFIRLGVLDLPGVSQRLHDQGLLPRS